MKLNVYIIILLYHIIFSSFGNDEIPSSLRVDWLYEHVWSLWSKWLPAEAEETVLRGGYYTASPSKGHRIVALNSMDCYLYNWWLFYNATLIQEQLQWFHDTLLSAEEAGESVHILTHIPAGDGDCWCNWSDSMASSLESSVVTPTRMR